MNTTITQTTAAELAELRAEIGRVKAELIAIPAAPLPLAEAERALERTIERMATYYDPDGALSNFIADADPQVDALEGIIPNFDPFALRAFLAAVIGGPLRGVLLERLRARYAADPVLADTAIALAARPGRLAGLSERLRDLERAEERMIVAAERAGMRLDRRADADPAVIFEEEPR